MHYTNFTSKFFFFLTTLFYNYFFEHSIQVTHLRKLHKALEICRDCVGLSFIRKVQVHMLLVNANIIISLDIPQLRGMSKLKIILKNKKYFFYKICEYE